jgi:uncharacterized membrane protein YhaH (DUF805 family)
MGIGRINRLTYWLAILIVMAAGLAVAQLTGKQFPAAPVLLVIIAVPRLHDTGHAGWWALGVVAGEFAAGMAIALLLKPDQFLAGEIAISLVAGALLILLGVLPGDAGANRFAPAPPRGISYAAPEKRG